MNYSGLSVQELIESLAELKHEGTDSNKAMQADIVSDLKEYGLTQDHIDRRVNEQIGAMKYVCHRTNHRHYYS